MLPAGLVLLLQLFVAAPAPAQVAHLEIIVPVANGLNPAIRPPIATYEWMTAPGSADPVEVRHAFVSTDAFSGIYALTENYIISTPNAPEWSAWQAYLPPGTGTSLTTPPMDFGGYVFAVQGKDGSGTSEDLDTTRNMRRIRVSNRSTGPLLAVTGNHIDTFYTTNPNTPPVIAEVNAGLPIEFCWTADASSYGGIVTGYRYGWDITDLGDDAQWAIDFTPFATNVVCSPEQTFYFGTHTFSLQVEDNDGYRTLAQVVVNIKQVTPVEKKTWGAIKALYR